MRTLQGSGWADFLTFALTAVICAGDHVANQNPGRPEAGRRSVRSSR